ncbi:hypothetical protein V6Z11_A10G057600 [Gossypium hirsutum]
MRPFSNYCHYNCLYLNISVYKPSFFYGLNFIFIILANKFDVISFLIPLQKSFIQFGLVFFFKFLTFNTKFLALSSIFNSVVKDGRSKVRLSSCVNHVQIATKFILT